jgi:hypothetical protein
MGCEREEPRMISRFWTGTTRWTELPFIKMGETARVWKRSRAEF